MNINGWFSRGMLLIIACGLFIGLAHAQSRYPTPADLTASVPLEVPGCLNGSNQAIPQGSGCASGASPGSSANPSYVTPKVITETPTAGSITTGGTTQVALAASSSRLGCQIENTATENELIDVGATPVTVIQPGGTYTCNPAANQVTQQAINIKAATTGDTFVVTSW